MTVAEENAYDDESLESEEGADNGCGHPPKRLDDAEDDYVHENAPGVVVIDEAERPRNRDRDDPNRELFDHLESDLNCFGCLR